jgi:pSer/pThr/pTyr-binding forkhead associated (FHA) protein
MVSGTHAILTVHSNGDLGIADLGSANGTFVNGQAVAGELRPLRPGDDVLLGTSNCRLGFDFS